MAILSKEDTAKVVESFGLVAKDLPGNGCKFFQYLFRNHPEVKEKYFPDMGINDEERLSKHGAKVLRALAAIVNHVKAEDDVKLMAKITQVVNNHAARGITTIEPYQLIVDCLVAFLCVALGDHLDEEGKTAWKKLFDAFVSVVGGKLDEMSE